MRGLCALGLLSLITTTAARAQLTFSFTYDPAIDTRALAGFQAAANRWSSLFSDPMTVSLNIGFQALPPGVIGSTATSSLTTNYSPFKSALLADRTSGSDFTAASSLQAGSAFNLLLNRTSNSPAGSGSATPYLDSDGDLNNTRVRMTLANARALKIYQPSGGLSDGQILFSSAFAFDFDPSNGIGAGLIDFTGVAMHEIGHALGFISGVDFLDTNSPPVGGPLADDAFNRVSPLDFFRFSTTSRAYGPGVFDWTADTRFKYFSIDGGNTANALFSTGRNFGDGWQNSHWRDNSGFGMMDPTTARGELVQITPLDLLAFDVIGYDLRAVPEPMSLGVCGVALLGLIATLRRRKRAARG